MPNVFTREGRTSAKVSGVNDQSSGGENREAPPETSDERPKTREVSPSVQCPNCCKLAPVTARQMGLLFYRCELCGSVGATPEPQEPS